MTDLPENVEIDSRGPLDVGVPARIAGDSPVTTFHSRGLNAARIRANARITTGMHP